MTSCTCPPEQMILDLISALNKDVDTFDIDASFEAKSNARAVTFETLKRKWEGFTGVPAPKKMKIAEVNACAPANKENSDPNQYNHMCTPPKEPMKALMSYGAVAASDHPDDKLDVPNMLVVDLRLELRKRGLDTKGRKKELQMRLEQQLAIAKKKREAKKCHNNAVKKQALNQESAANAGKSSEYSTNSSQGSKLHQRMDVDIDSVKPLSANTKNIHTGEQERVGTASITATSSISMSCDEKPQLTLDKEANHTLPVKAPRSVLKAPKYGSTANCAIKSIPTPATTETSMKKLQIARENLEKLRSGIAKPHLDATKSPVLSRVRTPGAPATQTGCAGSAKVLEKKKALAAASEARLARLAEMRGKSKPQYQPSASASLPTAKTTSFNSKYTASSNIKVMAKPPSISSGTASNKLLAKLREKAAAEKAAAEKGIDDASTLSSKSEFTSKLTVSTSSTNAVTPQELVQKSVNTLTPAENKNTDTQKKPVEHKPLSPMQTYEMSDREDDSESDEESEEESEDERPKKAIPQWAQKGNLIRALEIQFADSIDRMDPDKIFGEVLTCNLEEIFDKKKARYQRRTSSGNWTKDHVTLAEKLTYKRVMGFDK